MRPLKGLRYDALHDTWVIIALGREERPCDQRLQVVPDPAQECPFCPGVEHETPPEIFSIGRGQELLLEQSPSRGHRLEPEQPLSPDWPSWRLRIFPNRFPAVSDPDGRHEVVVITADHNLELADLGWREIAEILVAVQARVRVLEAEQGIVAVLFFLNAGAGAGASLAHAHGQILATSVVPSILQTEIAASSAWRQKHGTCLICDLAVAARRENRLIAEEDDALILAPLASRFSWEMLIQPRDHEAHYSAEGLSVLSAAARLLGAACRALRAVLGRPAYNLVLHTAPTAVQDFHWHLELLPRLSPMAGFETGAGFFINPVRPEDAAARLRRAVQEGQR